MSSRELSVGLAILGLSAALAVAAPSYFATDNLRDIFLSNAPVLITAIGMTLVVLTGHIDISVGSNFAICGVVAGLLATAGLPMTLVAAGAIVTGAALGSLNGALTAYAGIPSIVVTLATMVAWRDGLRWATQGAWVQGLPPEFQWLGLTQASYPIVIGGGVIVVLAIAMWSLGHLAWGRAFYATGSNREAARLAGLDTSLVVFAAFLTTGALTGLAALVNVVRFNQVPANAGLGLEMKVIAAVVVGGTAITGGRGSLLGTLLGVVLLGAIGPALTFIGVSAYWERAIQGAIILAAVAADAVRERMAHWRAARAPAGAPVP
jgi:rhamnose transport system permease protein